MIFGQILLILDHISMYELRNMVKNCENLTNSSTRDFQGSTSLKSEQLYFISNILVRGYHGATKICWI